MAKWGLHPRLSKKSRYSILAVYPFNKIKYLQVIVCDKIEDFGVFRQSLP